MKTSTQTAIVLAHPTIVVEMQHYIDISPYHDTLGSDTCTRVLFKTRKFHACQPLVHVCKLSARLPNPRDTTGTLYMQIAARE